MSAEQVAHFRSRYSAVETSPMLPENQPKSEFTKAVIRWWSRLKCCYRCFCGSKFRIVLTLLASIIVIMMMRDATLVSTKWLFSHKDTAQSSWQSYGLLHEPLWKWKSRKGYYHSVHTDKQQHGMDANVPLMDASLWFERYGSIDFVCPTEQAIIDTTTTMDTTTTATTTTNTIPEKWFLCNPQAMAQHHRGCLIYTSGRPDVPQHRLEHALIKTLSKPCDIHVFDPFATGNEEIIQVPVGDHIKQRGGEGRRRQRRRQEEGGGGGYGNETLLPTTSGRVRGSSNSYTTTTTTTSTITVHPWGLTGSASSNHNRNMTTTAAAASGTATNPSDQTSTNTLQLKSLSETWQVLNHGQRILDLLILDCAGCEWDVYTDLVEPVTTTTVLSTSTISTITTKPPATPTTNTDQQLQQQLPALPLHVLMQIHALSTDGSGGSSGNDYHSLLLHHMEQQHYVRFHRVPQIWNGRPGHAQAYSFLKLRSGFFT